MERNKVLLRLDDGLVRRLDDFATTQGTIRSEFIRRGAIAMLEAADLADADRRLRDPYRNVPQDPALVQAVRSLATRTATRW